MPRRNFKKKRTFRRRKGQPWYNKKYSVAQLAKTAYKGVRFLKGIINSERKFVDTQAASALSSTGDLIHLNAIAEGATESTRNGISILMKTLHLRYATYMNSAGRIEMSRFMIIVDTQQVGDTPPAVTDILESSSYTSPLNRQAAGRFTVLMDKTFSLSITGAQCTYHKFNIPVNLHARYNGSASSDIQLNGLYLLRIDSDSVNHGSSSYWARLNYYDN